MSHQQSHLVTPHNKKDLQEEIISSQWSRSTFLSTSLLFKSRFPCGATSILQQGCDTTTHGRAVPCQAEAGGRAAVSYGFSSLYWTVLDCCWVECSCGRPSPQRAADGCLSSQSAPLMACHMYPGRARLALRWPRVSEKTDASYSAECYSHMNLHTHFGSK